MPSDFILSAWKAFKDLPNDEEYNDNFNKTLSLVFENISVERFPTLLKDLLNSAVSLFIIFCTDVSGTKGFNC